MFGSSCTQPFSRIKIFNEQTADVWFLPYTFQLFASREMIMTSPHKAQFSEEDRWTVSVLRLFMQKIMSNTAGSNIIPFKPRKSPRRLSFSDKKPILFIPSNMPFILDLHCNPGKRKYILLGD